MSMRKLVVILITASALCAQERFEFWPGATYDPAVPTFEKVLGYGPGGKLASHADVVKYFETLSVASGGRMKVVEYAKSWEGRKLFYAVIASEANQKKMAAIQGDIQKLADPRKTSDADAQRIMAGLPAVRVSSMALADFSKFDVLILPDATGDYAAALGAGAIRRLKEWVANGGTVIGIEAGVEFLADARVGLLATAREAMAVEKKVDRAKPDAGGRVPGQVLAAEADYLRSIEPENDQLDAVQGILGVAKTDPDHWLTAGVPAKVTALVQGRTVFSPLKLNAGTNVAYFEGADKLVASGYMWEESRKQMAYKPLVMVQREGRGHVIGFTNDPNFRGYMDGMNIFFLNAVFRGVAHSR